jgi:hypothetical protein
LCILLEFYIILTFFYSGSSISWNWDWYRPSVSR